MRIISKIHDYYDSAMSLGVDTNRVFVRENRDPIYINNTNRSTRYFDKESSTNSYYIKFLLIGFCGEMFPCIRYQGYGVNNSEPKYIYTNEALSIELPKGKPIVGYDQNDIEFIKQWLNKGVIKSIWYAPHDNNKYMNSFKHIFMTYKTPYFVIDFPYRTPPRCNLMPILRDYKFYKIKDSYTAYQDIDMFLHNQLCDMDNPHIEPIPDVIKAQSKGFNKYSFRKDKSK